MLNEAEFGFTAAAMRNGEQYPDFVADNLVGARELTPLLAAREEVLWSAAFWTQRRSGGRVI
jgi:hypothetical protein